MKMKKMREYFQVSLVGTLGTRKKELQGLIAVAKKL
jgi:hypothetical protein